MIVDTSVLVAIITLEPDGRLFEAALESSPVNRISAATYLEVEHRHRPRPGPAGQPAP